MKTPEKKLRKIVNPLITSKKEKEIGFLQDLTLRMQDYRSIRLEENMRKERSDSLRVSNIFTGDYEGLLSSFQHLDLKGIWPEERNTLYGIAITKALNHVNRDFFFGTLDHNGSYNVSGFLNKSGFFGRNFGTRIAQATYSNYGDAVVSVEKKIYFPTIAETVDFLNKTTGMKYTAIK